MTSASNQVKSRTPYVVDLAGSVPRRRKEEGGGGGKDSNEEGERSTALVNRRATITTKRMGWGVRVSEETVEDMF